MQWRLDEPMCHALIMRIDSMAGAAPWTCHTTTRSCHSRPEGADRTSGIAADDHDRQAILSAANHVHQPCYLGMFENKNDVAACAFRA